MTENNGKNMLPAKGTNEVKTPEQSNEMIDRETFENTMKELATQFSKGIQGVQQSVNETQNEVAIVSQKQQNQILFNSLKSGNFLLKEVLKQVDTNHTLPSDVDFENEAALKAYVAHRFNPEAPLLFSSTQVNGVFEQADLGFLISQYKASMDNHKEKSLSQQAISKIFDVNESPQLDQTANARNLNEFSPMYSIETLVDADLEKALKVGSWLPKRKKGFPGFEIGKKELILETELAGELMGKELTGNLDENLAELSKSVAKYEQQIRNIKSNTKDVVAWDADKLTHKLVTNDRYQKAIVKDNNNNTHYQVVQENVENALISIIENAGVVLDDNSRMQYVTEANNILADSVKGILRDYSSELSSAENLTSSLGQKLTDYQSANKTRKSFTRKIIGTTAVLGMIGTAGLAVGTNAYKAAGQAEDAANLAKQEAEAAKNTSTQTGEKVNLVNQNVGSLGNVVANNHKQVESKLGKLESNVQSTVYDVKNSVSKDLAGMKTQMQKEAKTREANLLSKINSSVKKTFAANEAKRKEDTEAQASALVNMYGALESFKEKLNSFTQPAPQPVVQPTQTNYSTAPVDAPIYDAPATQSNATSGDWVTQSYAGQQKIILNKFFGPKIGSCISKSNFGKSTISTWELTDGECGISVDNIAKTVTYQK